MQAEVSMAEQQSNVWTVFVGDNGDQLEVFNSQKGPFPPDPGVDGYIAIGWPAVGDMELYEGNYADYVEKFRKVYPNDNERVLKTQANMPWNFAFSIKEGDFVICPSSATGYLLVGKILAGYMSDFHNEYGLYGFKKRADFVHLRKVQWLYIVSDRDPRYSKLNRLGQLTVSRPDISVDDLKSILNWSKSE